MFTQSQTEILYSITYVEDYLDAVTDLPDDLQKHVSRMKEYDADVDRHTKEAERLMEVLTTLQDREDEADQKTAVAVSAKLQGLLIRTQEIGDAKLEIVQQIQDMLDNKTRQLELDQKNTEYAKPEPVEPPPPVKIEPVEKKRVRRHRQDVFVRATIGPAVLHATATDDKGVVDSSSRTLHVSAPTPSTSQAVATTSTSQHHMSPGHSGSTSTSASQVMDKPVQMNWGVPERAAAANSSLAIRRQEKKSDADKKKYKQRRKAKQAGNSPPNLPIDPDEPLYCLCDQVSYGEMIGCDNDLCPIEWFHFSCVSLTTKPKGKWYCPKCRGDRPTLMKPKAVFLKELEKYNREKEEKS